MTITNERLSEARLTTLERECKESADADILSWDVHRALSWGELSVLLRAYRAAQSTEGWKVRDGNSWFARKLNPHDSWTDNEADALQLATRKDAQAVVTQLRGTWHKVEAVPPRAQPSPRDEAADNPDFDADRDEDDGSVTVRWHSRGAWHSLTCLPSGKICRSITDTSALVTHALSPLTVSDLFDGPVTPRDGIAAHMPSRERFREQVASDPDVDCEAFTPRDGGETPDWQAALRDHWLYRIQCHHEQSTDTAWCCCGWGSEQQPNVQEAANRWVEHVASIAAAPQPHEGKV